MQAVSLVAGAAGFLQNATGIVPNLTALFHQAFLYLTNTAFCILIWPMYPMRGLMGGRSGGIQVGDQAPIGRQEFHAEAAKLHSRLDRLGLELPRLLYTLSEERISRTLETDIGDIKRLLERCLNTTPPVWNEGVEHPGPVVPS